MAEAPANRESRAMAFVKQSTTHQERFGGLHPQERRSRFAAMLVVSILVALTVSWLIANRGPVDIKALLVRLTAKDSHATAADRDRVFALGLHPKTKTRLAAEILDATSETSDFNVASKLIDELSGSGVFVLPLFEKNQIQTIRRRIEEGKTYERRVLPIKLLVEVAGEDDLRFLEAIAMSGDDEIAAEVSDLLSSKRLASREFANTLISTIPLADRDSSQSFASALAILGDCPGETALMNLVELYKVGPTRSVRERVLSLIIQRDESSVFEHVSLLDLSLVGGKSRDDAAEWGLTDGYSMWWSLLADIQERRTQDSAYEVLRITTGESLGTKYEDWRGWWTAGGRPKWRGGRLDAEFLKWASNHPQSAVRLDWFRDLLNKGWTDEREAESGREAYRRLYINKMLPTADRVSAASAGARIGDREALLFLIDLLEVHRAKADKEGESRALLQEIHKELRSITRGNAFDDPAEWRGVVEKPQ